MREIIGQQLIIGLSGEELTEEEAQFIVENNIGGVILFGRNYTSPEQIHKLITDVQRLRYQMTNQTPLFVSIDMEGGRVHRLKDPFTKFPAVAQLGKADSSSIAFKFGQLMGKELKAIGVNVNLAPCIDTLYHPEDKHIGDRAMSPDSEVVTRLSSALVRGYMKADVLPVAKHFPGYGYTTKDSHFDIAIDDRNLKQMEDSGDWEPFKRVIKSRIDFIMTAHTIFPNIDPDYPGTVSKTFLTQILREALRFRGLIMTDDLDMQGLTKKFSVEEIPVLALKAGANILLYCNEPESPVKAMKYIAKAIADGELDKAVVEKNYQLITELKKKKLKQPIEPFSIEKVNQIISSDEHKTFAKDITESNFAPHLPDRETN